MGAHRRALVLVVIVFAVLGISAYFFSTALILDSFAKLEIDDTAVKVRQVIEALDNSVANIASKAGDWAVWDEMYEYMQGLNLDFISATIFPRTFVELEIDFMIICDLDGKVAFAMAYDSMNMAETPLPRDMEELLYPGSPVMEGPGGEGHAQGLVTAGGVPVMLASRQILTGLGEGPPLGYVIFGCYLDAREIERLEEQTHHSIAVFTADELDLPSDVEKVRALLSEGAVQVRPLNADTVAGYAAVDDLRGAPAVIIRVDAPRSIYQRGSRALSIFLSFLIPALLVSLALIVWLLLRLSSSQRALEEKARQLSVFLSIVSHELRHPVTIIRAYADLISRDLDTLSPRKIRKILASMDNAADRLTMLTEELVDVSRIESGSLQPAYEEVDVRRLVAEVVGEMKARGLGPVFETHMPPGDITVPSDRHMLSRLLVILLENAAKFSPPHSPIEIEVEEGKSEVAFSVKDRGPGVPLEDAKRIFDGFYQREATRHHSKPGMGLGLFIAREIVGAHGGKIWYEPREGGGSVFRFTLPRGDARR